MNQQQTQDKKLSHSLTCLARRAHRFVRVEERNVHSILGKIEGDDKQRKNFDKFVKVVREAKITIDVCRGCVSESMVPLHKLENDMRNLRNCLFVQLKVRMNHKHAIKLSTRITH